MQRGLITGSTGQDGSYLVEYLLSKGYEVHGLKRRSSSLNTERLDHVYQESHDSGARFFLQYADLTDASSVATLLHDLYPDEI
jgi:GDPmannose 4,6-dehydratase